jgi:hypothetical protein
VAYAVDQVHAQYFRATMGWSTVDGPGDHGLSGIGAAYPPAPPPGMMDHMKNKSIAWPRVDGSQMADVIAYLNAVGRRNP